MPYGPPRAGVGKDKGKTCVFKKDGGEKDGGEKVGCTDGSIKKYMAALHINANESYSREEVMEAVHEVLEEYYSEEALDEELENYFNSNLSEESGGSYSKNTARNKDNIARKAHKREYEAKYGKCNGDLHHPNGLSSSKVVCEPASKNRGRPGEGGRKKGKKKRDPRRGRKTKKSE